MSFVKILLSLLIAVFFLAGCGDSSKNSITGVPDDDAQIAAKPVNYYRIKVDAANIAPPYNAFVVVSFKQGNEWRSFHCGNGTDLTYSDFAPKSYKLYIDCRYSQGNTTYTYGGYSLEGRPFAIDSTFDAASLGSPGGTVHVLLDSWTVR